MNMDWKEIAKIERDKKNLRRHNLIQDCPGLQIMIKKGMENSPGSLVPLPTYHKRTPRQQFIGISVGSISDVPNEAPSIGMFKFTP